MITLKDFIKEADLQARADYKTTPSGRKTHKYIRFKTPDDAIEKEKEDGSKEVKEEVKGDYERKVDKYLKNKHAPVAPSIGVHRIAVTTSEPDHPMVTKRKETTQRFVRVTAHDKDKAVEQGMKHFKKKGFKVHGAEHVSMVHEEAEHLKEYEIHHDGKGNYRDDEGNEWNSKTGNAHRSSFGRRHTVTSDVPHAVHINGKKWKSFGSQSHAQNVANKIKGATVHKEEVEIDESAWGKDKMTNLRQAHDRHMEKALAANKAGDDEAVKTHQRKMQMIKTQMQKLKQNEEVEIDEATTGATKLVHTRTGKDGAKYHIMQDSPTDYSIHREHNGKTKHIDTYGSLHRAKTVLDNEVKEEVVTEVSSELLDRYKTKAKQSADDLTAQGKHKKSTDRWMGVMKATGKQIDKTTAGIKKALNKEEVELTEEHLVHVSDGSKYGDKPHKKDVDHVMAGAKKHKGEFDGNSDKGAYFKFKSHSDAHAFKKHVDSCPGKSCYADLHEEIELEEDIKKEYDVMKKHDIGTLRNMIKGQHKIIDTSEFRSKDHAISHYLRTKHGDKRVAAAMGLKEEREAMLSFKSVMEKMNLAKADMGDVIKDFKQSDAPQFAGKSDEKKRQMAIAAKLQADRGVKEELKGGQKNLDKNKNGKLDAQDFKLLRKEEEEIDELDKSTLKSYINKNIKSGRADDGGKGDTGLYRATNKVAGKLKTGTLDKKVKTLGNTSSNAHKNPYEYDASRSELKNRGIHNFAGRRTRTEEVEMHEAFINGREYASHGLMHPDHAKLHKTGETRDFYAHGSGDKVYGKVTKNDGKAVHMRDTSGKTHQFKVTPHLPKQQDEGVGFDNEGNLVSEKLTYSQFMEQLLEYTPGPGGVTRVQGRSYGAQYHDPEGDDNADDQPKAKPAKPADEPKRGRGRPAGTYGGAYKARSADTKAAAAAKAAASKAANKKK